MDTIETPALGNYISREEFLPLVRQHFPTNSSLNWFIQLHRNALAESGAMISLAHRLKFEPTIFQREVVRIGRNAVISRKPE